MSFEVFCQTAVARVAEADPQLVCVPSADHWPANIISDGVPRTDYTVQVWSPTHKLSLLGTNIIHVGGTSSTAEQALHDLGRELAALKAKREYDAKQPA